MLPSYAYRYKREAQIRWGEVMCMFGKRVEPVFETPPHIDYLAKMLEEPEARSDSDGNGSADLAAVEYVKVLPDLFVRKGRDVGGE